MTGVSAPQEDVREIFATGVRAADPATLVAPFIGRTGEELTVGAASVSLAGLVRIVIVGAGKAAPRLAEGALDALAAVLPESVSIEGTLLVPEGLPPARTGPLVVQEVRPADANRATPRAVAATEAVLARVATLGDDTLLLCLLTGGGSATLAAPLGGLALDDQLDVVSALDGRGAPITALNTLRRHLSAVKGGRLAVAAGGARAIVSLLLSDVDGDPPEAIASGPAVADPTTFADAIRALDDHELEDLGGPAVELLRRGARGEIVDTPDELPSSVSHAVIGSPDDALRGAAAEAGRRGWIVEILGRSAISSADHIDAVRRARPGTCLLSAGEIPLALPFRPPPGGRCCDLALRLGVGIDSDAALRGRVTVLVGATDGEDGTSGSSGAVVDSAVLRAAEAQGLDPARLLERCDALTALRAGGALSDRGALSDQGALLEGGATGTNVQDLRVILVHREGS